jgi:2-keto-4-pentenoate hydratase/2-oxohepta-3-ene-1,7-dioic acid hydratase in catechol pathway
VSHENWTRLARCVIDNRPRLLTWSSNRWHVLPPYITSPLDLRVARFVIEGETEALDALPSELLPPLEPARVIGVGLNYRSHAIEVGAPIPKNPLLFAKFNTTLIGHGGTIRVDPRITQAADWEVELAVVLGKRLLRASPQEAKDAILGYTVANDVTARDVQLSDVQWTRSKCHDTFGPLGPWIVPPSAIDAGNARLRAWVNGAPMQDGTTADLIFDVPELLSFCSWSFTLLPGDVFLTGTPPGVGGFRSPPIYLQHGDTVECAIDGIGTLSNRLEMLDRSS